MIIIVGTLLIFFLVIVYGLFNTMVQYAQHPTTIYFITWFFGLLTLNVLVAVVIYGYYYYKKTWNPFSGVPGLVGLDGPTGQKGINTINYQCVG
jgi:hypothetical protein